MNNRSEGQALLLVLLSIGVIITVALSVVSRSITDVQVTTKDEESLRAFSAAEAGAEQILSAPIASLRTDGYVTTGNVGTTQGGGSGYQPTYSAKLDSYPTVRTEFVYPTELSSGDTSTIWLSEHDTDNSLDCSGSTRVCYTGSNLRMCWGKTGVSAGAQPAVVASILYEDTSAGNPLKFAYATYDPSASRRVTNSFNGDAFNNISTNTTTGAATFGGMSFANCATLQFGLSGGKGLNLPGAVISGERLRAVTVMLLYNTAPTIFGVTQLPAPLPIQGRIIESTGAAGESSRKVQVYALYPEIPTMFQAALFSPPGVTK